MCQSASPVAAAHRAILEMHRDDGLGWCTSCGALTLDDHDRAPVGRDDLSRLMVGRELSAVFPKRAVPIGAAVLELVRVGCAAS